VHRASSSLVAKKFKAIRKPKKLDYANVLENPDVGWIKVNACGSTIG
jgi:hypothetical protein